MNKFREKTLEMFIKKNIPDTVATVALNIKISKVENKIPDASSLMTATVLNTKNK